MTRSRASDVPVPVNQEVLDDLKRRLQATRYPALPSDLGWSRGTDPNYLAGLIDYWADRYDWRRHEEWIRALPWERAGELRLLHQRAADDQAPTVVLLHGWPDSVLRFARVLPLLVDVNVVVPCLPGFPWAEPRVQSGMSTTVMARLVGDALHALGYERYVVSGGDIGAGIAERVAAQRPECVGALHLTDIPYTRVASVDEGDLGESEREYIRSVGQWQHAEGAYAHMQSTKPHTAAAGLADSPAGLAAWIVEKLRSWSDCAGDVEGVFPRDELLTWVTAYWVTDTIGTSFSAYVEPRDPVEPLDVPTAVTLFPLDLAWPPRVLGERFFDIRVWDEKPGGGHFGAWERPEDFVDGVRAAVGLLSQ